MSKALTLKLTTVGSSTGVVIPKDMLAALRVEKGDLLYAIETADGFLLSPYDPEIEEQLSEGRAVINDQRETFKALDDEG